MKKLASIIFLCCLFILICGLTACGTSSDPDFYSLAVIPGTPIPDAATVIKVERTVIAGYLDRPDFVQQESAYELTIDDTNNWAEPIGKMFSRVLAADLQQRLPQSVVVTEDNAMPAQLRYTIDLNIDRFNLIDNNKVLLEGQFIITDKTSHLKATVYPVRLTAPSDNSAESIVENLSQVLSEMADQIAVNFKTIGKI